MNLQNFGKRKREDINSENKFTIVLFIVYLIALFWILLFKLGVQFSYMATGRVNLIPFSGGKIDIGETILNVVIFVPVGVYAGALFKMRTFGSKLSFLFLLSSMFETLQFIFKIGAVDITDIINNTLGGIAGVLIFNGMEKLFKNTFKAQRFINVIAAIGTVLMISLLLLLKLNLLPVRYQ